MPQDRQPRKYCVGTTHNFCLGELVWVEVEGSGDKIWEAEIVRVTDDEDVAVMTVRLVSDNRLVDDDDFKIIYTQSGEY